MHRDSPAEPGTVIRLRGTSNGGELDGYYKVTHAGLDDHPDRPGGRHVYSLLPERAWNMADPVTRRHHEKNLSVDPGIVEVVEDHAPACRTCGELWPCEHARSFARLETEVQEITMAEEKRRRERQRRKDFRARYETPGVCPACRGIVATGQPFRVFDTNAVIPNGPAVTYHVSRKCGIDTQHHSMQDYMRRLRQKEEKK